MLLVLVVLVCLFIDDLDDRVCEQQWLHPVRTQLCYLLRASVGEHTDVYMGNGAIGGMRTFVNIYFLFNVPRPS